MEEEDFESNNSDNDDIDMIELGLLNRSSDEEKKRKNNNKNNIFCSNKSFICSFFIIESLISIGLFYLFYLINFGDKNNNIYEIIEFSLLGILTIFYIVIPLFINSNFYSNHEKCRNYILFILISIFKICFFIFVYLITVLSSDGRLSFGHFEARVYWKISVCLCDIILIFYSCFIKDEDFNKCKPLIKYILLPYICDLIFFFHVILYPKK